MHASIFALDLLGFCLNESEKIVGFEWFCDLFGYPSAN